MSDEEYPQAPTQELSPGMRAVALFREAKALAEENVNRFMKTLESAVEQAREIAEGGELYPAGVRDVCDKLTEHTAFRAQTIESIMRPGGSSLNGSSSDNGSGAPHPFDRQAAQPEQNSASESAS